MTQAQHTPAPWRAKLSGKTIGKSHIIHDDSKYPNGMFGLCHVFGETPEQEHANARLIAASPELLEALELALQAHDDDKSWEDLAIAAIAKARGQV